MHMEIILYCAGAFLGGILVMWLISISASRTKQAELAEQKEKLVALETENRLLDTERGKLSTALSTTQEQLAVTGKACSKAETLAQQLEISLGEIKDNLRQEKEKHWQTQQESVRLQNNNHRLGAELKAKEEQLVAQKQQLEEIGSKFTREFQVLAQQVLEEKTESFHKLQEKNMTTILHPLKENIEQFKTAFETRYNRESEERISLREQIRYMMELNNTLSTQANDLTNALRGQVKQQGNWGEMILESILEYADLQKGIHYFPQEASYGESGQLLQPDIIVRYPDQRAIVIDSKVSLVHYEQYITAEHDQQKAAMDLLLNSVYRHIDNLSGKRYQDAVGALDFVMLFVPVEGAYITIMQADRQLWQYAYKKRVLLTSPTNLIAAMKLVYDLWKRDGINQEAQQIAERAVKIYEKLAAFVEDFEKVGTQLDKATLTFSDARKKLHTGRGNVISQALQMKQKVHHTKPNRDLPPELSDEAMAAEQDGEEI